MATARKLADKSEKLRVAMAAIKAIDRDISALMTDVGRLSQSEAAPKVEEAADRVIVEAEKLLKAAKAAKAAASNSAAAVAAAQAAKDAAAAKAAAALAAAKAAKDAAAAQAVAAAKAAQDAEEAAVKAAEEAQVSAVATTAWEAEVRPPPSFDQRGLRSDGDGNRKQGATSSVRGGPFKGITVEVKADESDISKELENEEEHDTSPDLGGGVGDTDRDTQEEDEVESEDGEGAGQSEEEHGEGHEEQEDQEDEEEELEDEEDEEHVLSEQGEEEQAEEQARKGKRSLRRSVRAASSLQHNYAESPDEQPSKRQRKRPVSANGGGNANGATVETSRSTPAGTIVRSQRARMCGHPGCTTRPSFGVEGGSKKAEFCAQHAKAGMLDVVHKRPSYGVEGSSKKAELCAQHAKAGMVDVVGKRCGHPGCTTSPSYGVEGSSKKAEAPSTRRVDVVKKSTLRRSCNRPSLDYMNGVAGVSATHHPGREAIDSADPKPIEGGKGCAFPPDVRSAAADRFIDGGKENAAPRSAIVSAAVVAAAATAADSAGATVAVKKTVAVNSASASLGISSTRPCDGGSEIELTGDGGSGNHTEPTKKRVWDDVSALVKILRNEKREYQYSHLRAAMEELIQLTITIGTDDLVDLRKTLENVLRRGNDLILDGYDPVYVLRLFSELLPSRRAGRNSTRHSDRQRLVQMWKAQGGGRTVASGPFVGATAASATTSAALPAAQPAAAASTQSFYSWDDVRGAAGPVRPRMVMPLSVEPSKPRLIYDARSLNQYVADFPFSMDTVGRVAQVAAEMCFMTSIDDASAFHHIGIYSASWPLLGFSYEGVDYVWRVLPFGFKASPWVYHTLGDAKASFLRSLSIPALAYLDDSLLCNYVFTYGEPPRAQWLAACDATYVAMLVSFLCGCFLSVKKCDIKPSTLQKYLGMWCDSEKAVFRVPQDRLDKMQRRLREALATRRISFDTLRSVAGQGMSMSVAIRPAALYTQAMFATVAALEKSGAHAVDLSSDSSANLLGELRHWLDISASTHEGPWQLARHFAAKLTLGASDASSLAWGGVVFAREEFRAGGVFPSEWMPKHINFKEMYALHNLLLQFCEAHPEVLRRAQVLIDVDNTAVVGAFTRGRAKDRAAHDLLVQMFRLQVDYGFLLSLKWVPTAENVVADAISRPSRDTIIRLKREVFLALYERLGPFNIDLMACAASVQSSPRGLPLRFFSQYSCAGTAGVDILAQDVSVLPGTQSEAFGFCFPPPVMVGPVLQHLRECQAHAVLLAPDTKAFWFPLLKSATVRSVPVADVGEHGVFCLPGKAGDLRSWRYPRWAMRAFEMAVHYIGQTCARDQGTANSQDVEVAYQAADAAPASTEFQAMYAACRKPPASRKRKG
eukprot:g15111.t1